MRYINVDAYVIPKHCKYGPRPAEGIVLNPYEWLSIRDHLIREQKEKELAAIQRAKEEAKKEISVNMTQMWDNTLASLKRQGNLKRIERIQKEKQDKIDQYNEIMKRREEKKRAMEEEVKKKITDEMDFSKTIKNAIHYATVQDSWDKEIEFHQTCKKVRETPAKEALLKFKKEAEEFEKEKKDEEVKEREKKVKQRLFLDKQMEEIRRKKEAELEELKLEKQDLINMKIEEDKIKECELYDKINRKNMEIKLRQKTKRQLEYEKNVQLEEEEENEIIRIYTHYDRRFKKERKQREQQYKDAINAHRQVMIDKLSEGLREAAKREMERIEAACLSKEEEMVRQDKRKEKMRQKALKDILDGKREAELNRLREKIDRKEGKKWEMMQVYRSAEINEAWRKTEAEKRRAAKAAVAAGYDMQCKEAREKEAREKEEERLFRVEVDMQEKEEVLKHCQQALDFVKKYNLPEYAVNKAVYNVKREFGLLPQEEPQAASPETTCNKKQLPQGCNWYCFKY